MTKNLYTFFVDEHALRWKAILWSWTAGTIASTVAVIKGGSTETIAEVSLAVSGLTLSAFVAIYITASPNVLVIRSRRSFMSYVYAASAAIMLALVERIMATPQAIHAATADVLMSMQARKPLSTTDVSILRSRTQRLLQNEALSPAVRKMAVSDYAVVKAALEYSQTKLSEVPAQRATFRNTGTGTMFDNACRYMFTDVNFISTNPDGRLVAPACPVVFKNVAIEGFTQRLDGVVWIDVLFERCSLSYAGKGLTLVNVIMKNCDIRIESTVPVEIRDALLSPSGPITIASID